MIDPFVLLAPVLLLAVVALLRFVGCASLLGVDDVSYKDKTTPVSNPQPQITGFDPPDATAQDPAFQLTVNGSNFVPGLTVTFGNTPVSVIAVTPTQIKVTVPASEVATSNTNPGVTVTVINPDTQTASATFTIHELVQVTFSGPEPTTPPGGPPAAPPGAAYKNLVFDPNWAWERSTSQNNLNHIFFVSPQKSGSFTFANGPRLLKSMKVSAGPAGNITVSDPDHVQNTTGPLAIPDTSLTSGNSVLVPINWRVQSKTVTVSFDQADSIGIDTIRYQGPP